MISVLRVRLPGPRGGIGKRMMVRLSSCDIVAADTLTCPSSNRRAGEEGLLGLSLGRQKDWLIDNGGHILRHFSPTGCSQCRYGFADHLFSRDIDVRRSRTSGFQSADPGRPDFSPPIPDVRRSRTSGFQSADPGRPPIPDVRRSVGE